MAKLWCLPYCDFSINLRTILSLANGFSILRKYASNITVARCGRVKKLIMAVLARDLLLNLIANAGTDIESTAAKKKSVAVFVSNMSDAGNKRKLFIAAMLLRILQNALYICFRLRFFDLKTDNASVIFCCTVLCNWRK